MGTELFNKREIEGWLRDGITSLPTQMTGMVLKHFKIGKYLLLDKIYKDTQRWFVSRVSGLSDRARGFYRPQTSSIMTGKIIRRNKLTDVINVIYGRVWQADGNMDKTSEYGRAYQTDTGIDLNLGGVLKYLSLNEEVVVYKISAQFVKENLLWEDITNSTLYSKI